MPPSETRAISSIDAREFSDLLVSGRTKDLKILAGRLSQHARASQGKVPVKPLHQHGSGHCKVDGAVGVSRNVGWLSARPTTGPRLRKQYSPNYYAAFVLDPDGNIKGVYRGA
jgi:hypothetical protein